MMASLIKYCLLPSIYFFSFSVFSKINEIIVDHQQEIGMYINDTFHANKYFGKKERENKIL